MKKNPFTRKLLVVAASAAFSTASPAIIIETYDFTSINAAIPDGSASGVADFQSIASAITSIQSVTISLTIDGTYNGDLYAYLTHDSGFSVLLNRSGRSLSNSFGYDDDGFSVVFDDTALHNIHLYQTETIPAAGNPLTGIWQPDGRNIDPDLVLDTTPATANLSSFNGIDANGNWTLFVADLSGGDTHTLNDWGVTITGIPEPSSIPLIGCGILGFWIRKRLRN